MSQVMFKQLLQIVRRPVHAFLAVSKIGGYFTLSLLPKQQRPRRGCLKYSEVAFLANATIEDDPSAAEQLAIFLPVHAGDQCDPPTISQTRYSAEPGHPFALHGGMEVADKKNVDVALTL